MGGGGIKKVILKLERKHTREIVNLSVHDVACITFLLQEIRQRNVLRTVYFASCGPLHPKVSYESVSNISKKPPTPSKNVKVLDLAT